MRAYGLLGLVAVTLAALPVRAEEIVLTSGEWRPYMSEHLPHYGVISRVVTEAFAIEGVTVRYVFRPWTRALAEAGAGKVQGSIVWSEGAPGSSRQQNFMFSDIVLQDESVFFYRKAVRFRWQTFGDLSRYRIGGVSGYGYLFEGIDGVRIDRASSDELAMRKLVAARFDVLPSSRQVGLYSLRRYFSPADIKTIAVHPRPYNVTRYYLILPRASARSDYYRRVFNRGLQRLKDSGRYNAYLAALEAGRY